MVVWFIHSPAGAIAILAAAAAFYYPKGSQNHKKTGRIFAISMFIMLISGGISGVLKGSADDVFLAALVLYSIFTAWLATRRRRPINRILEYFALLYIIILGLSALAINPEWEKVKEPGVFTFYVVIALLFAAGDIWNILCQEMKQSHRLARHIWRISFSLVWSALAFSDKIIKMLDSTIEQQPYIAAIPALLVLCIMVYWLFRVYRGRAIILP